MNKYTEGLEKVGDRYRIYENISITKEDLVEVKQSTLTEADTKGLAPIKSYRMNIWEQGKKNKNNRNYDTVFECVLNEGKITYGLMDHPIGDSDGSPKDIWSVQSTPLVENGWLTAQITLVGEYGQLAEDVLNAGGCIMVSSSALGRVNENGQIEQSGFLLERYADWVLNPSNGFSHFKNEMTTQESTNKPNDTILENDNKKAKKLEENIKMDDNRLLKVNLKGMIREAEKVESPKEKNGSFGRGSFLL